MQQSMLISIIIRCVVNCCSVVPNSDRILFPTQARLELWSLKLSKDKSKQGVALLTRKPLNPVGKVWINVNNFFASNRMGTYHRMNYRKIIRASLAIDLLPIF